MKPNKYSKLLVADSAIVYQQIYSSVILKLTINTKVSGSKPRAAIQKGLYRPLGETHYGIFSRCISAEPHVVDRVKTYLAEVALDGFSVNLILYSGYLNMGITVVWESKCMSISIVPSQMARLHITCHFLNKLSIIVISVDLNEATKEAVKKLDLPLEVEYITDVEKIMEYGVMRMPALVINDKVVSMGKVLKAAEVEKLLKG